MNLASAEKAKGKPIVQTLSLTNKTEIEHLLQLSIHYITISSPSHNQTHQPIEQERVRFMSETTTNFNMSRSRRTIKTTLRVSRYRMDYYAKKG
ncbi:hypothetical protein Bca4012_084178 [Brassica carinata]